jgi:hypothetical protein
MGLTDFLSFVIPASALGIAYVSATLTFRKLPAGIPFLNFHLVAYGVLLALNGLLMVLMQNSRAVDLKVDDGTVFLATLFAGLGAVFCLVLAPLVWFFRRRSSFQAVTQYVISCVASLPYVVVILILLFYRE